MRKLVPQKLIESTGQVGPIAVKGKDRLVYYIDRQTRVLNRLSLSPERNAAEPEVVLRGVNPSQISVMDKLVTSAVVERAWKLTFLQTLIPYSHILQ